MKPRATISSIIIDRSIRRSLAGNDGARPDPPPMLRQGPPASPQQLDDEPGSDYKRPPARSRDPIALPCCLPVDGKGAMSHRQRKRNPHRAR